MISEQKAARDRVISAAVELFSHRGYHGVGVREIAQAAGVNVSMISYYFQGKAGVLREILKECQEKYAAALQAAGDESTPAEEHVRRLAQQLVRFFRENLEMASIGFDAIPIDVLEVLEFRMRLIEQVRDIVLPLRAKLGLDPADPLHANLGPGSLFATVLYHFQWRLAAQHAPGLGEQVARTYDDQFYERFADGLAQVFLSTARVLTDRSSRPGPEARPRQAR